MTDCCWQPVFYILSLSLVLSPSLSASLAFKSYLPTCSIDLFHVKYFLHGFTCEERIHFFIIHLFRSPFGVECGKYAGVRSRGLFYHTGGVVPTA